MNPRCLVRTACQRSLQRIPHRFAAVALVGAGAVFLLALTGPVRTAATSGAKDLVSRGVPERNLEHVILAWNNLGMHCYNRDCADFLVLPPFNNLWAQVIHVADPPQIVTSGVTLDYSMIQNSYSAGNPSRPDKTNFWQYVDELFGVELPVNVGLAGKGLSGQLDATTDHYVAAGIPLTEYRDQDARPGQNPNTWTRHPYQLARLIARDSATGARLAQNVVVTPVSSELSCNNCHSDDGDATTRYPIAPTGKVETNILAIHDFLSAAQYPAQYPDPLMLSRPVLCAKCHSSNALNAPGVAGITSLSNAMHNHHKDLPDITPDTDGCFQCHPGPQTQCLRCTMSQNFSINCTTCHGEMAAVAQNPSPWLNEPRCDSTACHGSGYPLDQPLYQLSKGHGGVYCAGCHDSPHAIATSREGVDAIKFIALQGHAGTLRDCTVCHLTQPTLPFVHIPR